MIPRSRKIPQLDGAASRQDAGLEVRASFSQQVEVGSPHQFQDHVASGPEFVLDEGDAAVLLPQQVVDRPGDPQVVGLNDVAEAVAGHGVVQQDDGRVVGRDVGVEVPGLRFVHRRDDDHRLVALVEHDADQADFLFPRVIITEVADFASQLGRAIGRFENQVFVLNRIERKDQPPDSLLGAEVRDEGALAAALDDVAFAGQQVEDAFGGFAGDAVLDLNLADRVDALAWPEPMTEDIGPIGIEEPLVDRGGGIGEVGHGPSITSQ